MNLDSIIKKYKESPILNEELKDLKNKLSGMNFSDLNGLYSNYEGNEPKNDIQKYYVLAQNMIVKSLAEPIFEKLHNDQYSSQNEFNRDLDSASEKFFYTMLDTLGIEKAKDADPNWLSVSILTSKIIEEIRNTSKLYYPELDAVRDYSFYDSQEEQLSRVILRTPFAARNYSINNVVGKNYPVRNFYSEFAEKGDFKDLANSLLYRMKNFNGRYEDKDLDRVTYLMLSKALNRIYERNDISPNIVSKLIDNNELSPVHLWDSESFQRIFAPVMDDEMIAKGQEYMDKHENKEGLIFKLKEHLSREEIFNYFIPNEHSSLDKWTAAMAQFGALTGEKLTFKEALAMKPKHNFSLDSTKAYSDMLDNTFDGNEYRNIELDYELIDDINDQYYGEQAFEITMYCKSLSISSIQDEMSDQILKEDSLSECSGGFDGMRFEGSTDSENPDGFVKNLAENLNKKLEELNLKSILPGDIIEIVESEDYDLEDYNIKAGKKALVVDVDMEGDFKIKGSKDYMPSEIGKIKRKHSVNLNLESNNSLSM